MRDRIVPTAAAIVDVVHLLLLKFLWNNSTQLLQPDKQKSLVLIAYQKAQN